jgi:hypothetical protein
MRSRKLRLICDACGKPAKSDGYVVVDDNQAFKLYRAARSQDNQQVIDRHLVSTGAIQDDGSDEFLRKKYADCIDFSRNDGYGSVPWQVFHDGCIPEGSREHYGYDVDRFETESDLIDRMLHLNGKNWIEFTNWDNFVRKVVSR